MSAKYNPNSTVYFFGEFLEFVRDLEKEFYFEIPPFSFSTRKFKISDFEFKFEDLGIKNRDQLNNVLSDVLDLVTSEYITKKEHERRIHNRDLRFMISSRTVNERNI